MLHHPVKPFSPHLLKHTSLIAALLVLVGCVGTTHTEFYNSAGELSHAVQCPAGSYEICLREMSAICGSSGYTILEKIRQTPSRLLGEDIPQTLLVARCNISPR